MNFQLSMIEATKVAAAEAFKYAKQVPEEKLRWRPLDQGRSVLSILQELAHSPNWAVMVLKNEPMPDMGEMDMADDSPYVAHLQTVEACEAETMKNLAAFYEVVAAFPDERLSDTYVLPFDGGQTITMMENIAYPQWNFNYHTGQIAYIQTLYGDSKMYW